uniref:peptidoglycan-binding domain-containing protein n=1 Tax=Clostridioides difficile TaxID=1496 RepID=UPI0021BD22E0|nr:peptidoglycan-binding domain-containing protein [Clostridioides difficile]UWI52079.1 peptidoglycan-binding protein [Clostridioides difficile]
MLKKFKKILILICCFFMMGSTVFAETQNSNEKSFTISGYIFTYENAPQEIKDKYEENCSDIGIEPQPNDEIFITPSELKTYSDIDMYAAKEAKFTVTYHYSYYDVSGDKNYRVNTSTIIKYGDSGNAVHLAQLLLKKVGYALDADSQFGSTTRSKVKSFQGSYGLTADGIVGSATWQKFASATNLD